MIIFYRIIISFFEFCFSSDESTKWFVDCQNRYNGRYYYYYCAVHIRLLIFSEGNFFSGICVVEFFSTAKIPLSVCVGGGIFKKGWGNF